MKVYPHFFMEVIVRKMQATVDKFACLDKANNVIKYTLKGRPKHTLYVDLLEGERIFQDLYGARAERWNATDEFKQLQERKHKAARRRKHKATR